MSSVYTTVTTTFNRRFHQFVLLESAKPLTVTHNISNISQNCVSQTFIITTCFINMANQFGLKQASQMKVVKVAVRMRPLLDEERESGLESCVLADPEESSIYINFGLGKEKFAYDHVFNDKCSNKELYESAVKPMLNNLFAGQNLCIISYGQTGSGKTYTMGTSGTMNSGIIPNSIGEIFQLAKFEENKITVSLTILEIYQDQLNDLLNIDRKNTGQLEIRENPLLGIHIPGLTQKMVQSWEECLQALQLATQQRQTAKTAMNASSSRSHLITTFKITSTPKNGLSTVGSFVIVDLAGNEKPTQNASNRFNEGVSINTSLLNLGTVLKALGNGTHVPFRGHKLTRILKDSLSGNSHVLVIGCVSPLSTCAIDTLNTLQFCNRAKRVKVNPKVNMKMVQQTVLPEATSGQPVAAHQCGAIAVLRGLLASQRKETAKEVMTAVLAATPQTRKDLIGLQVLVEDPIEGNQEENNAPAVGTDNQVAAYASPVAGPSKPRAGTPWAGGSNLSSDSEEEDEEEKKSEDSESPKKAKKVKNAATASRARTAQPLSLRQKLKRKQAPLSDNEKGDSTDAPGKTGKKGKSLIVNDFYVEKVNEARALVEEEYQEMILMKKELKRKGKKVPVSLENSIHREYLVRILEDYFIKNCKGLELHERTNTDCAMMKAARYFQPYMDPENIQERFLIDVQKMNDFLRRERKSYFV